MNQIQFGRYEKFSLATDAWGDANPRDIINLLDSVICDFYSSLNIQKILERDVLVRNSSTKIPPTDKPEIVKLEDLNVIFLSSRDRTWCQYSYQFSHELCHHVINSNFYTSNDKFGWFEESLCELASLFTLQKMATTWQTNPPYPNWTGYSVSLYSYVADILAKPEHVVDKSFHIWLSDNLEPLLRDRYRRVENTIIAMNLLPIFNATPELWQTIQYLKNVSVTDEMGLTEFLVQWKLKLPRKLRNNFLGIEQVLLGQSIKRPWLIRAELWWKSLAFWLKELCYNATD